MNLEEEVSVAEFAELLGVSTEAVYMAIRDRRLKESARRVGREWRIDLDRGVAEWAANTSTTHGGRRDQRRTRDRAELLETQIQERKLAVAIKAIELERLRGKFVEVEGVQQAMQRMGSMIKTAILNIPERCCHQVAAHCPGLSVWEVREILLEECRQVLRDAVELMWRTRPNADTSSSGDSPAPGEPERPGADLPPWRRP